MPTWAFKALKMREGLPVCLQLPKQPASLHFYDAKLIELLPTSPNYYSIVELFHDDP